MGALVRAGQRGAAGAVRVRAKVRGTGGLILTSRGYPHGGLGEQHARVQILTCVMHKTGVDWSDIAGLEHSKAAVYEAVIAPLLQASPPSRPCTPCPPFAPYLPSERQPADRGTVPACATCNACLAVATLRVGCDPDRPANAGCEARSTAECDSARKRRGRVERSRTCTEAFGRRRRGCSCSARPARARPSLRRPSPLYDHHPPLPTIPHPFPPILCLSRPFAPINHPFAPRSSPSHHRAPSPMHMCMVAVPLRGAAPAHGHAR